MAISAINVFFLLLKINFDICLLNSFETWPRSTCRAGRQRTSPGPWTSRSPARKVAIMVGKSPQHHTRWTETIIWSDFPQPWFLAQYSPSSTVQSEFPPGDNAHSPISSSIQLSEQLFIESERVRGTWRRVRPVVLLTLCHSWGAWGEALPIKSHLQSLIYNLWHAAI